jgi:hypothetical protein
MILNNIKDLLVKSLNKTWKQNQIISSIIWKSVVNDFLELKNINIHEYIISIKVKQNKIVIKTQKPILNTELLQIKDILERNISKKLNSIWIKILHIELSFQ